MALISDDELRALAPAETAAFPGPIPTQIVSSDEFMPRPRPRASAGRGAHQGARRRRWRAGTG